MRESPLKQRVFDALFTATALAGLLDRAELQEVVAGLRATYADGDERVLICAVADAFMAYAAAEAQV